MPIYRAPVEDVTFLLNDVFQIDRYDNLPGFSDASADVREAILGEASTAANRSLTLANALFREGYSDFQRVLDAQRALFAQQDAYLVNRSAAVGNLIALYKALGGGWQTGQPLVDAATRQQMEQRTDWGGLIEEATSEPAGKRSSVQGDRPDE